MDVADGVSDLAAQLLLLELHVDDLVGEAFVEEPVDLGAARQLARVDLRSGALDVLVQVLAEVVHHLHQRLGLSRRVIRTEALRGGRCMQVIMLGKCLY